MRVFLISTQVVAAMLALIVLRITLPGGILLSNVLETSIAVLAIHNYALFPKPLENKYIKQLTIGGYVGVLLLFLTHIFLALYPFSEATYQQVASIHFVLQESFLALGFTVALTILLVSNRQKQFTQTQQKRRLLMAGLILGLLPLLLLHRLPTVLLGKPFISFEWVYPFLAFIPITYTYAIYRGDVGHIDNVLNRTLVYGGIFLSIAFLYAISFVILNYFLPQDLLVKPLIYALIGALSAYLFPKLRLYLQHFVDKLFYGSWYDYRLIVKQASTELSNALDIHTLTHQVFDILKLMRFKSVAFMLSIDQSFQLVDTVGFSESTVKKLKSNWWLKDITSTIKTTLLIPKSFDKNELLLPLVAHGSLKGMLVLGERQGNEPLAPEDEELLFLLANQIAILSESLALIEQYKQQLQREKVLQQEIAQTRLKLNERREQEKQLIAQEIHDGPIQDLISAKHLLDHLDTPEKDSQEKLSTLLTATNKKLRELSSQIRPLFLHQLGLEVALQDFILKQQEKQEHITFKLSLAKGTEKLPFPIQFVLFRVTQEAITNTLKHASASHLSLFLNLDAEQVILKITDNGKGFELPQRIMHFAQSEHLGIIGMQERIESVQGNLIIKSTIGVGTEIFVTIPLARE